MFWLKPYQLLRIAPELKGFWEAKIWTIPWRMLGSMVWINGVFHLLIEVYWGPHPIAPMASTGHSDGSLPRPQEEFLQCFGFQQIPKDSFERKRPSSGMQTVKNQHVLWCFIFWKGGHGWMSENRQKHQFKPWQCPKSVSDRRKMRFQNLSKLKLNQQIPTHLSEWQISTVKWWILEDDCPLVFNHHFPFGKFSVHFGPSSQTIRTKTSDSWNSLQA